MVSGFLTSQPDRKVRRAFRAQDAAPGRKAALRATNVSLDAALVAEAKELGVSISQASNRGLEAAVKQARGERWLEENRAAMDAYNAYIEANGLPLADLRLF